MFNPRPNPSPFIGQQPQGGEQPVGSVVAFAGNIGSLPNGPGYVPPVSSPPQTILESWGYMLCDGRSLSRYDYTELFAVLGNKYGGTENEFNIPDYRGYFLRGQDGDSNNDPGLDARKPPSGGKKPGEVGSDQGNPASDVNAYATRPKTIDVNYIIKFSRGLVSADRW